MGQSPEQAVNIGASIAALHTISGIPKVILEDNFNVIAHAAGLHMRLMGRTTRQYVLEAIFQHTSNGMEAILYTVVGFGPLTFGSLLVRNMSNLIPQYAGSVNIPEPRTWSMAHVNALREKYTPPDESMHYDQLYLRVTERLKPVLQNPGNSTYYDEFRDLIVTLTPAEVAAMATLAVW